MGARAGGLGQGRMICIVVLAIPGQSTISHGWNIFGDTAGNDSCQGDLFHKGTLPGFMPSSYFACVLRQ